ncbi:hypothetical protein [Nesterenkonia sp. NBAIMH1]|uniref:hypothetical protein n=1 Tax=Nesterenkonia sp. NBAIMH1 TaxID=2600320 RepID=UPI0011B76612|nr:hypothetical protein [Nesterenkonia sp. NBAIMH1]
MDHQRSKLPQPGDHSRKRTEETPAEELLEGETDESRVVDVDEETEHRQGSGSQRQDKNADDQDTENDRPQ